MVRVTYPPEKTMLRFASEHWVVAGEAQEVGGVVGGDGGDAVFCVEPAAAVAGDAGVQQPSRKPRNREGCK